jgi:hypothetical protein
MKAQKKNITRKIKSAGRTTALVPAEAIQQKIHVIRRQTVMLSTDLARLYQVEPRALVQAVKRNPERFPMDFMFHLSASEQKNLKSQTVISSWGGSRRAAPYAFTEQGIAMLSSVLRSGRAVQVNIAIMRAFVELRQILATHEVLRRKILKMERNYDAKFQVVFAAIKEMLELPKEPRRPIGFHPQTKS